MSSKGFDILKQPIWKDPNVKWQTEAQLNIIFCQMKKNELHQIYNIYIGHVYAQRCM